MSGCNIQSRGTVRIPLRHGSFTTVPDFFLECNFTHEQPVFKCQEDFEPKLCPPPPIVAYCPLSNGTSFVYVDVFNFDGKLVNVSVIQVIV